VKTRGIRGEVVTAPLSDFPERYESVTQVRVRCGERESLEIVEDHWFHKNQLILKFKGRNRPHEVSELVGGEVLIPDSERHPVPEDTFYHSDLVGCEVLTEQERVGIVVEVLDVGGLNPNLVVEVPDGRRLMVPLARHFIQSVDTLKGEIRAEIPEGLWDVAEKPKKVGR
jgi:16S rRNA processing protein RimM